MLITVLIVIALVLMLLGVPFRAVFEMIKLGFMVWLLVIIWTIF